MPKPLASLSSTLLARKGTARPAMRPQGFAGFNPAPSVDDLGWNDMGSFEPASEPVIMDEPAHPVPPVLLAREALKEEIETPPVQPAPREVRPVSLATAARIGRESAKQTARRKAAFTLRLDTDRHLRLRLASAVVNRSSQILMTEALDAFLKTLPEVEELASQLPAPKAKRD